jgi:hypothetical protein
MTNWPYEQQQLKDGVLQYCLIGLVDHDVRFASDSPLETGQALTEAYEGDGLPRTLIETIDVFKHSG